MHWLCLLGWAQNGSGRCFFSSVFTRLTDIAFQHLPAQVKPDLFEFGLVALKVLLLVKLLESLVAGGGFSQVFLFAHHILVSLLA
jgi:hypothetical protein